MSSNDPGTVGPLRSSDGRTSANSSERPFSQHFHDKSPASDRLNPAQKGKIVNSSPSPTAVGVVSYCALDKTKVIVKII